VIHSNPGKKLEPGPVQRAIGHGQPEQDAGEKADGEEASEAEPDRKERQASRLCAAAVHCCLPLRGGGIGAMVGRQADPSNGWKVKPAGKDE
jgi:hypothetical protein